MTEKREKLSFDDAKSLLSEWLKVERAEVDRVIRHNISPKLNKAGHWSIIRRENPNTVELKRVRLPSADSYLNPLAYELTVQNAKQMDQEKYAATGDIIMNDVRTLTLTILHGPKELAHPPREKDVYGKTIEFPSESANEIPAIPEKLDIERGLKKPPRRARENK